RRGTPRAAGRPGRARRARRRPRRWHCRRGPRPGSAGPRPASRGPPGSDLAPRHSSSCWSAWASEACAAPTASLALPSRAAARLCWASPSFSRAAWLRSGAEALLELLVGLGERGVRGADRVVGTAVEGRGQALLGLAQLLAGRLD